MGKSYKRNNRASIALVFCVLWCISPPMFVNPQCRVIALFCMVWCLIAHKTERSSFSLVFFFGVLYFVGTGVATDGASFIIQQIQTLIVLVFSYIAVDKRNEYTPQKKGQSIENIVMLVYPIFMVLTLRAYVVNPRISRMLVNNQNVDVAAYSYQGVGGYGMIYSLVFYNIICLYWLLFRKERKLLAGLNYALSLLTVLKAGYSIALISLVAGTFIVVALGRQNRVDSRLFLLIVVGGLALLLVYLTKDSIISAVTGMVQGTLYEQKWEDIVVSLQGESSTGTLEARNILYQYSIQNFLEHPILGTWTTGAFMFGGHSLILDTFARFGIVGGIPIIYILIYYPLKQIQRKRCFGLSVAILFEILFIGAFNNWAAAIAPILYLMYPITVENSLRTYDDGTKP